MSVKVDINGDVVVVSIEGSFDVSAYDAFKEASTQCLTDSNRFIIDMAQTTYLDSSALGMLLLLREKTAGDKERVKLINVGGGVKKVLEIAQFQKLFDVEYQE